MCCEGGRHLRQESLAHHIHAPHVRVHGKVPVVLLAVQNGAVVHEAVDDIQVFSFKRAKTGV